MQTSIRLREARTSRGWSQPRLVRELRQAAARRGQPLPSDASVKRRIASWENGHSLPDGFYGPLLCDVYGTSAAELGLSYGGSQDSVLLDASYPASPDAAIRGVGQLWRADLNGYEPLLQAEPSEPAWSEASLRWLVAPEPPFPSSDKTASASVWGMWLPSRPPRTCSPSSMTSSGASMHGAQ